MAFPAKILCFLLFCVCFSSAREVGNSYFGKYSPSNAEDNAVPSKEVVPSKQEGEPEPTFIPENHNGYGLYGREIDQGTRFTYSHDKHSNEFRPNSEYMFNNRENRNNYGYDETRQNSLYANNEVNEYNRDMNRFPVQQQGMSDTRFLENGKYFYDVNNEELYKNRYHNQVRNVFVPSRYRGENSRSQYNQEGMDENSYKFNNYMENNNQEGQEEYIP